MTRTIDVTGLPDDAIQLVESQVNRLRERNELQRHPLFIQDATVDEWVAGWQEMVADFADNEAVIEDDSRRVLYADQPKC